MLSTADAARAIQDITNGKTAKGAPAQRQAAGALRSKAAKELARRTCTTAAALFAWGLEHGHIRARKPVRVGRLNAPCARERFLSSGRSRGMLDALTDLENKNQLQQSLRRRDPPACAHRRAQTEILGLRWSGEFARTMLILPPERTKAGGKTGERRVVLSPSRHRDPLQNVASRRSTRRDVRRRRAKEFVDPGLRVARDLRRATRSACEERSRRSSEASNPPGVRIHDLRHSRLLRHRRWGEPTGG